MGARATEARAWRGRAAGLVPRYTAPRERAREAAIEFFLDRGNPLHWIAVAVLLVSGVACAWLGVRDGFIRRTMRTSSGVLTGSKAVTAGVLYVATGVAGIWGALQFLARAR